MVFFRWFGKNLSTVVLSLILAIIVWGSAVTANDPNQERVFSVPIELIGQQTDIEIIGDVPERLLMTLYAPQSILDDIAEDTDLLRAWVDLSTTDTGTFEFVVQYLLPSDVRPLRLIDVTPKTMEIKLERLISKTIALQTSVQGEPALGYQIGELSWSDTEVTLAGLESHVEQVASVSASLDIAGVSEDVVETIILTPRDANGNIVPGVAIHPDTVTATQLISLRGGYRNMVIKVTTVGQVAEGYRQTNITVSPPNVMIFSADPVLVDQLPGYIETDFLDLTGAVDDIETILALNLPEGVSVIGDPNVLVQVSVAAIEGSLSISRQVEVIGLLPDLTAAVSPDSVEVILYGPIPTLETMTAVDVRVVVDLTEKEAGIYQLKPDVIILPDQIRLQVLTPETLEIEVSPVEQTEQVPTPAP